MADREIPTATPQPGAPSDPESAQQLALLRVLMVTVQHFFGRFPAMFADVHDPRHRAYIRYSLPAACFGKPSPPVSARSATGAPLAESLAQSAPKSRGVVRARVAPCPDPFRHVLTLPPSPDRDRVRVPPVRCRPAPAPAGDPRHARSARPASARASVTLWTASASVPEQPLFRQG